MELRFVWDDKKAESNCRKHGISFEEAVSVFDDPLARSVMERIVDGEERWQIVGMSSKFVLLLVIHTVREADNIVTVRIISARKPDRSERNLYERG